MKPCTHRTSCYIRLIQPKPTLSSTTYFSLKPKLTPNHLASVWYTHLYSDSTIVLLPDLCNNHKLKQCCSRNNRKIIDSHSTPAVTAVANVDGGSNRLSSNSSSSSLSSTSAATAETARVTAMTNATAPPQPILIASKPNACVTANDRSLSASPTAATATELTPPNTPSPVFYNERSSTNSSTAANSGRNLSKNIHPNNHELHPHYQHHQQRAYEQSIPLNPSPKIQIYSRKLSGQNPAHSNLVHEAIANDDGKETIAIDRNRRKGSYKKRKKMKKREKHN